MSTILVVDDDDAFRDSIIDVLEDEGHEVTGTCDPFAALKRLMTHDFDLIITDMLMPDQDGAYLIKQLRQLNIRSKII